VALLAVICAACGGGGSGAAPPTAASQTPAQPAPQQPTAPTSQPPVGSQPDAGTPPPGNRPPTVASFPFTPLAVVARPFTFDLAQGGKTFVDPDGDPLMYTLEWHSTASSTGLLEGA